MGLISKLLNISKTELHQPKSIWSTFKNAYLRRKNFKKFWNGLDKKNLSNYFLLSGSLDCLPAKKKRRPKVLKPFFAQQIAGPFFSHTFARTAPNSFWKIGRNKSQKPGLNLSTSIYKDISHTYNTRMQLSRLQRIYRFLHLNLRVVGSSLWRLLTNW